MRVNDFRRAGSVFIPRHCARVGLLALAAAALFAVALAPVRAIEHDKPAGEPYTLEGKRIVFTNWIFIRTGQLDWKNEEGKSVYSSGDWKLDPMAANFDYYDFPYGIRIVAEPAQRGNPILAQDRPYEKMGIAAATLMFDDGKYRLWGSCQDANGKGFLYTMESTDLLNWNRPNLGQIEYEGSKENNLIDFKHLSVFKDPTAPPEERYKAVLDSDFEPDKMPEYKTRRPFSVMATESDPGRFHSIRGAVSPDGYKWKMLDQALSVEPSDTQIVCEWDARLKKYVMYTRSYMVGPRAEGYPNPTERRHQFIARRSVGRTESENFREFPLSEVVVQPGPEMAPTDTFYTNCKTTIPGAPDHHLLFPATYHQADDTTGVSLYSSYDNRLWMRLPGSPVLPTAPFGEWDGGCLFATPNLVETPEGDWVLPYTGFIVPHKYPRGAWSYKVGLARWPKGRMVALQAPEMGEFTMVGVIPPGQKLRINAQTERAGWIRVEAAGFDGVALDGRSFEDARPIIGDQFWTPVTWTGGEDLGLGKGEPVVLRFRLKMAKIYGLEFES